MTYNNLNTTISTHIADVTGDGIEDIITIRGYKEKPSDIFIRSITLIIEDGSTKKRTIITPKENNGYNPRVAFCDFNKDGILDILLNIDSGGSGAFVFSYVYSVKSNHVQELFDVDLFNKELQYEVIFKNNYKVSVYSKYFKKRYIIDVSDKKEVYKDIYDKNGNLIKPQSGFASGLNVLYPLKSNGGCNLLALQRIVGLYNADLLGYMETVLEWNGSQFEPIEQKLKEV